MIVLGSVNGVHGMSVSSTSSTVYKLLPNSIGIIPKSLVVIIRFLYKMILGKLNFLGTKNFLTIATGRWNNYWYRHVHRASGLSIPLNNKIVFEDSKVIVMNKWSGILVQGNNENSTTLLDFAKDFVKIKYDKKGLVFLGLVHRLDRVTSGLIVFARNSKSAAKLTAAFQENRVKKVYVCIVHYLATADAGTLINYLSPDASIQIDVYPEDYPRALDKGLKRAVLHYSVLSRIPRFSSSVYPTSTAALVGGFSLLRIELETGRKHQIRAQLSKIGLPIVGDDKYSPKGSPASGASNPLGKDVIALHSMLLEFPHPGTNELVLIMLQCLCVC